MNYFNRQIAQHYDVEILDEKYFQKFASQTFSIE